MNGDSLRIGIVGAGGLGMHLARGFAELDTATVTALAEIDEDTRRTAGENLDLGPAARYADHSWMISDADLDGVVIATPHTLHYEQVVEAMEADLHVLCEKPLTTDLDECRDLVDRAQAADTVLMVGYQRHLDPSFIAARRRIQSWSEAPKFITSEITQNWIASQQGTWRVNPDLSGGGQLYDTGSHILDALVWTTGLTPESVSAEMVYADEDERVDIQATLNVRFEAGTVASVSVSGDSPLVREHTHVWSDEGAIYLDGIEWGPRELHVLNPKGDELRPNLGDIEHRSKPNAFVDAIRGRREIPATAGDALTVTAITEAAYESAQRGERVPVDR